MGSEYRSAHTEYNQRPLMEVGVVVFGQYIPGQREVVVFVDESHVQTHWAGLAVVAIDAGTGVFLGGKTVIPLG